MVSATWVVVFMVTVFIGTFAFVYGELGIWFVLLIIMIISVFKADLTSSEIDKLETSIQSTSKSQSPINENDLQDGFSKFSWKQMEELTGKLFEKKGYSVEVTRASADFGIDVWASKNGEKIGIQVKHWNKDVGFDDVTKTLGSNLGKANRYILISTKTFFTNQAWDHQRQHKHLIELWDTNRFRKELRENFINSYNYNNQPIDDSKTLHSTRYVKGSNRDDVYRSPIQNKTDSFDYDKGFNIDEVYNQSDNDSSYDPLPEIGKKCKKCGSLVHGKFCGDCGNGII